VTVSTDFDTGVRDALAVAYQRVHRIVFPDDSLVSPAPWTAAPGSEAEAAPLIELPQRWITQASPIDLPLSIAHGFMAEAADQIATIGTLQSAPESVRFATIGPLARAASERAATVRWLFDRALTVDQRLARALVLELHGSERLLSFLRSNPRQTPEFLERLIDEMASIAEARFGVGQVARNKKGGVLAVTGERLPSKTDLFRSGSAGTPEWGAACYGELSVFTHPTSESRAFLSNEYMVAERQLIFAPRSSVHDEGRLMEPCLLILSEACVLVFAYLGRDLITEVREWNLSAVQLWQSWCTENGCR
jgi:hypothetical protein